MTKEEYIKYVKGNEEINRFVEIASQLITIQTILIKSKLCSLEEFDKTKQFYTEKLLEEKYEAENQDALDSLKKINDFMNMFGGE